MCVDVGVNRVSVKYTSMEFHIFLNAMNQESWMFKENYFCYILYINFANKLVFILGIATHQQTNKGINW